jgi:hypothetical protein
MWKDKYPVLIIFTHAMPIRYPYMPCTTIPHRNRPIRENIPTLSMLLEYTTFMKGVDVADQLRTSYSSLRLSHKW